MKKVYFLTGLAIMLALPSWLNAQSFYALRKERNLIVSAGVGNATYFGDLQEPGHYFDARTNFSVGLQYFVTSNISLRSELQYFSLKGSDANADVSRRSRNLSFTSSNFEFNITGAYNLFPQGVRFYQRSTFNIYAFAGLGLLYTNPKAELNGVKYALQPLKTEGNSYSKFNPVIPYGAGVKLKINPFFNIAFEGGLRKTFTDYLDDVSTVHPDKSAWTDPVRIALSDRTPELGKGANEPGHIRGNPSNKDSYLLLSMKIEYYLPSELTIFRGNKLYNSKRKAYYRRPKYTSR